MVIYEPGQEFFFDLDAPLHERYLQLFPKYIPLIRQYVDIWVRDSGFTPEDLSVFDKIADTHPDRELIKESIYFAQICDIPFNQMLFTQYMYDFGFSDNQNMGCTSVCVRTQSQQTYIVRNLDWSYNDLIRALSITAHYTRKGKLVITQMAIVGQLSVGHTIKSSNVAMSLHYLAPEYTRKQLLIKLQSNPEIPSFIRFFRKLIEDGSDFEQVRQKILKAQVLHQGLINVISATGELRVFFVQDWSLSQKFQQEVIPQQDYIISTNGQYDKWSIQRLEAAQSNMAKLDSYEDANKVMQQVNRQYPNYNNSTIYSTILRCDHSKYELVI